MKYRDVEPERDLFFQSDTEIVYLLHFTKPLIRSNGAVVQHYIGSTTVERFWQRMDEHKTGNNGSPLVNACLQRGGDFCIAARWKATRGFEFWLKRKRRHKQFCPVCHGEPPITNELPF